MGRPNHELDINAPGRSSIYTALDRGTGGRSSFIPLTMWLLRCRLREAY